VHASTRSPAKDHVRRLQACSKNNTTMINVFTLTNINTKIIKDKLSKIFISEVCIKPVALRINRYTRSSAQCQKDWWPLMYNHVRWLSRGLVLKRFVECFYEIKIFLNDHHISYQELSDYKWVSKLMFFADFCEHLNELNVKLQGSGKALDVTFGYIKALKKKKVWKILEMKDLNIFKPQEAY